jgi:hypothetical protein
MSSIQHLEFDKDFQSSITSNQYDSDSFSCLKNSKTMFVVDINTNHLPHFYQNIRQVQNTGIILK